MKASLEGLLVFLDNVDFVLHLTQRLPARQSLVFVARRQHHGVLPDRDTALDVLFLFPVSNEVIVSLSCRGLTGDI